jgi:hypothetical protein
VNTPNPLRSTGAGVLYNDLRNLAKRHKRSPSEYFTLYVLEAFLARLAQSPAREEFVLKGGVLMPAFTVRRPTRDIDLATTSRVSEADFYLELLEGLLGEKDTDAVVFDPGSWRTSRIRERHDPGGIRIRMTAHLATAHIPVYLDVNFGDPIWPEPLEVSLPRLLGGTITLFGYPDHMVLAEKIVTAVEKGQANTRWRDFWDIYSISRTRWIDGHSLETAVRLVASHRQVTLVPLRGVIDGFDRNSLRQGKLWLAKQNLPGHVPGHFPDVLRACSDVADPAIAGVTSSKVWNPGRCAWSDAVSKCGSRPYEVGVTCKRSFPLVARDSRSR